MNQKVYKKAPERSAKNKNKFLGPFIITELLENNKVKIKNTSNNKIETIHMKELKRPHLSDSE